MAQQLSINPLQSHDSLLQSIVKHTAQSLLAEKLILPPLSAASNEAVSSEYVSEIMTALCLYFHRDFALSKFPQQPLYGELGRGPVDFLLQSGDFMVCVTEVKRYGTLEQGCAQNIAQLNAVLGRNKKRKRESSPESDEKELYSIGLVSNGAEWYVLKLADPTASGETSSVEITHLEPLPLESKCVEPQCISASSSNSAHGSSDAAASSSVTLATFEQALTQLLSYLIPPITGYMADHAQLHSNKRLRTHK